MEIFAISWKWGLHQTALWSYPKSNLWIYNAFLTIQLLFYMSFYHRIFTSVTIRKIIRYSVLPVVCFGFLDYVWIQTPSVLNSYSIIVYYIIFVVLALVFFHQTLQQKEIILLRTHPAVWISLGTFIYFSGALPFCIFLPYLVRQNLPLAISLFNINLALDSLMYSLYLISFLCKPQYLQSAC